MTVDTYVKDRSRRRLASMTASDQAVREEVRRKTQRRRSPSATAGVL
jgi:hypothetical protein